MFILLCFILGTLLLILIVLIMLGTMIETMLNDIKAKFNLLNKD